MRPTIYVPKKIMRMMEMMVYHSSVETCGIGMTKQHSKDSWIVKSLMIADYTGVNFPGYSARDMAAAASCTVDPIIKEKQILLAAEKGMELGFHFHSHVNMEAFWSGTDRNLQRNWNGKYLCAIVGNRRKDYKACVVEGYITGPETREARIVPCKFSPSIDQLTKMEMEIIKHYNSRRKPIWISEDNSEYLTLKHTKLTGSESSDVEVLVRQQCLY